jgi:hypothetical protein
LAAGAASSELASSAAGSFAAPDFFAGAVLFARAVLAVAAPFELASSALVSRATPDFFARLDFFAGTASSGAVVSRSATSAVPVASAVAFFPPAAGRRVAAPVFAVPASAVFAAPAFAGARFAAGFFAVAVRAVSVFGVVLSGSGVAVAVVFPSLLGARREPPPVAFRADSVESLVAARVFRAPAVVLAWATPNLSSSDLRT